jgi:hypothetical protein
MKTQVKWTPKELEVVQKYGNIKLLHELKKLIPAHTALAIKKKRTSLGIKFSDDYLSRKSKYAQSCLNIDKLCKINQSLKLDDLDNVTLQILIGSMLGDGGIHKTGNERTRNFIFKEIHRSKQFNYTNWKTEKLSIFHTKCSRSYENNYCQLWTASHPIFTMLRDKFYPFRNKCNKYFLPMDILSNLDYLGLMIWYLDDGYLGKSNAEISVKGWNLHGLISLIKHINKKLELSLYLKVYNHKNKLGLDKKIYINKFNINKLLPIWEELAIKLKLNTCMYYKLKMEN